MEIPLALPKLDTETIDGVVESLEEEFFLRGDSVEEFEGAFADYIGVENAVSVSSGTQALHLSLRSLGISEGDTVLTTPATFIATANVVVRTGATLRFVDVSLDTYTIDLDEVEEVVEKEEIDAIMPIHTYGYPVDMDRLREIAGDIPIVSDSCQAHGAEYRGERVGSMSTMAGFSFYPSKNMTVGGDGGMVTTDDDELADAVRSLRDVGRDKDGVHRRLGYTARMSTVNAVIGKSQLESLEDWNERRREVASLYTESLDGVGDLTLPPMGDEAVTPAWYLYVIRTDHRDELMSFLEDKGVETGIHYQTPVHLQPPYQRMGFEEGMFPDSEKWSRNVLSLPMHPHLTDEEVEYITDAVEEFFG
jgi:perosamine synthetase